MATHPQPAKQIALAFPLMPSHYAQAFRGTLDYARQHTHWTFLSSPETFNTPIGFLRGWPGDGAIVMIMSRADARIAAQIPFPLVNLTGALRETGIPRVTVDNHAVAQLAAAELLGCGFTRLAYYGLRGVHYSEVRREAFLQAAQQASAQCDVYEAPTLLAMRRPWRHEMDRLDQFLKNLKPPVGLLACTDHRARAVIEACQRLGLRVPDDVAVIGVDNDQAICEWGAPPLSSVAQDGYRLGYEAARLLDQLIHKRPIPNRELHIAPLGVVRRRSSDITAVEDPLVAQAVRYIRDHLHEPFGVENLAEHMGVSRRWIERCFQNAMQCSPHQYISRTRIALAQRLRRTHPQWKNSQIARAVGFTSPKRLRLVTNRVAAEPHEIQLPDMKA